MAVTDPLDAGVVDCEEDGSVSGGCGEGRESDGLDISSCVVWKEESESDL